MKRGGTGRGTRIAIILGSLVLVVASGIGVAALVVEIPQPENESGSRTTLWEQIIEPAPEEPATILFVGDMMFDRYIRRMAREHGEDHLLACMSPLLERADLVVGNLEGPITTQPSQSEGSVIGSPSNFRFTFPASTADLLKTNGISLVNLGNNHILDFGADGMHQTQRYLSSAGVDYFGGVAGEEPVHRTELSGIQLSFVNYNQFGGGDPDSVAVVIRAERASGRTVIVYTHWGEEYVEPTERMRESAQLFAESGAALVIGSHPHVVQESERIGATLVYYSLGNFIFDQYWDEDVSTGLAVLARISTEGVTAEEVPIRMHRDGRTCLK